MAKRTAREVNKLNLVYELLVQERQRNNLTKENLEDLANHLVNYKFQPHSIKLLKDEFFGHT